MSLEKNPLYLDALLHPARAYEHPRDVGTDDDLTLYEKRAILSSWASDACAVEDFPELREVSGVAPVKFDDIMDALRELDCQLERRVHWGAIMAFLPEESKLLPGQANDFAILRSEGGPLRAGRLYV